MHLSTIRIEMPVPKMGFVDHPLSTQAVDADIDQYANAQDINVSQI